MACNGLPLFRVRFFEQGQTAHPVLEGTEGNRKTCTSFRPVSAWNGLFRPPKVRLHRFRVQGKAPDIYTLRNLQGGTGKVSYRFIQRNHPSIITPRLCAWELVIIFAVVSARETGGSPNTERNRRAFIGAGHVTRYRYWFKKPGRVGHATAGKVTTLLPSKSCSHYSANNDAEETVESLSSRCLLLHHAKEFDNTRSKRKSHFRQANNELNTKRERWDLRSVNSTHNNLRE